MEQIDLFKYALSQHGTVMEIAPCLLLVGRDGVNHLLQVGGIPRKWGGEIIVVNSPDEALRAIGAASKYLRWRQQRDMQVLQAVRRAQRWKQSKFVFAREVYPHQDIYGGLRSIARQMAEMEQRGLLVRVSKFSGYSIPPDIQSAIA